MGAILLTLVITVAADADADARARYAEADRAYKLGQFEAAAALYQKAYEAKPLAGFLFNIAQCKLALEDYEGAIFFYEGYLREAPRAANRTLVQDLLVEARAKADAKREAAARKAEEERLALERATAEAEAARLVEEQRLAEANRKTELARLEQEERLAREARAAEESVRERARLDAEARAREAERLPGWVLPVAGGSGAAVVVVGLVAGTAALVGWVMTRPPPDSLGTHDLAAGAR